MHCISSVEHLFVYIKSRESELRKIFRKIVQQNKYFKIIFTEHTALGKRLLYQLKNNYLRIVSVGSLLKGFLINKDTTSYFY